MALGGLLSSIGHDLRTIVADEIELGHNAIATRFASAIEKIVLGFLAATVALIGFAMLCITGVVALQPLVDALWLRTLIMAVLYMALGVFEVWRVAKYHSAGETKTDAVIDDTKRTIQAIKTGLQE